MKLNALYVAVRVMRRSIEFYTRVFGREPVQVESRFSAFDLNGTMFGLFDPAADGENVTYGDNCVPNIEVVDIEHEHERLHTFAPRVDATIREVGSYRYFQFEDPDGNRIELYSVDT